MTDFWKKSLNPQGTHLLIFIIFLRQIMSEIHISIFDLLRLSENLKETE